MSDGRRFTEAEYYELVEAIGDGDTCKRCSLTNPEPLTIKVPAMNPRVTSLDFGREPRQSHEEGS